MGRLEGKVAVITGTSSGYGRSMARMFAKEGAKIACLDISLNVGVGIEEGDDYKLATHEDIVAHGGEAIYVYCDISDKECVEKAFAEVDKAFGKIDILVNNAGIWFSGVPLAEQTGEKLKQMLNINVMGSYYCAQQAIRRMVAQGTGGSIIQMSSTAGFRATAFEADYDITKGATLMLMQTITAEYSRYGIRSNAICPAYGYTPMGKKLWGNEVYHESVCGGVPLHKWVSTEDVSYYALFLASDESKHVNGTKAVIDGGQCALAGGGHAVNMENLMKASGMEELFTTVH